MDDGRRPGGDRLGVDLTSGQSAAHAALQLVLVDPSAALAAAEAVLARDVEPAERALALRAAGQACAETGRTTAAVGHLRAAVALSGRHGLVADETAGRISLSGALAARGRVAAGLRELDQAPSIGGRPTAQVVAQRGFLLARAGREREALECWRDALPGLRRLGDQRFEAILLLNRGAQLAERGELVAAERDLRRCAAVAEAAGLGQLVADAQNNLGYVAALAGDLPVAFAAFDAAQAVPGIAAAQLIATRLDRARVLLCARMASDATVEIERTLPLLEQSGRDLERADAELLLAQAALAAGEPELARRSAAAAYVRMRAQRRTGWAALAGHLELRARFAAGERGAALAAAARRDVARCERVGWRQAAVESRVLWATLLLEAGAPGRAAAVLDPACTATGRGPTGLRVVAWHAVALRAEALGDRAAALRAARAGLRLSRAQVAACGAEDLRAHAADHGSELAGIGLRLTLDRGDAAGVLRWSEAHRATALLLPPVRPPRDPATAADLASLRASSAALAEQIAAGQDSRAAARNCDQLRAAITARLRRDPGGSAAVEELDLAALTRAVGERALISFLRSQGRCHAVSLVAGRCRLRDLGDFADVLGLLETARFALLRTAGGRRGNWAQARRAALEHAVGGLDRLLCKAFPEVDGRDLVLVPTADLFRMPWSLLPSWRGRSIVVAPSARTWLRAAAGPGRRRRGVLLAGGPDLSGATAEVTALRELHPHATVLVGADATAAAVLHGLAGAELAHLACHGEFRDENPLFSSLNLADGPLVVHELSGLRRAPRTLVLSACDSARCAVRPGDELLGLTAALLATGTRTVVAAVSPVDDAATVELMIHLHRGLRAGVRAGQALADAAAATGVYGFVCLGAD